MKYRGVVYDVGLRFTAGLPYSVVDFDAELVAYDIHAIASGLHANAIRIEGEEIERLVIASRLAHAAGLTVFFNPWKMNSPVTELPAYMAAAARAAEQLRVEGLDISFVAGCEITLFNEGIFNGASVIERIQGVIALGKAIQANDHDAVNAVAVKLNDTLTNITVGVRKEFNGKMTYSAGTWETVDWSLFDIVGIDHYRAGETAEHYVKAIDRYRHNKPVVVMEVGCCTYEGAAQLGAGGFMRYEGSNPDGSGIFTDGIVPTRSEQEQADYVEEQVRLLAGAGIDGVFIYVFSFPTFPHAEGARDLDMVSFALVKTYPKSHPKGQKMPPWKPKEAFDRLASLYSRLAD